MAKGGARKGAGRPRVDRKRINITLPVELIAYADTIADTRSTGIEIALNFYRKKQEESQDVRIRTDRPAD